MKKERSPVFDILRFILVVLVVNLHIRIITSSPENFLEQFVYIAVPLFLVLSFYLMSKYLLQYRLPITSIFKRIKRLILPLIFWSVIGYAVYPSLFSWHHLFRQLLTGSALNVPLYYLVLLTIFTFIFWVCTYIPLKTRWIIFAVITSLTFIVQYSNFNYEFFNHLSDSAYRTTYGRFAELIPYPIMGLLFGYLLREIKKNNFIIGVLFFVFAILFFIASYTRQPNGFHYSGIALFSITIAIFSAVLLLSKISLKLQFNRVTDELGKLSFGVYLMHFIFLQFLLVEMPFLKPFIIHNSLLFLVILVPVCYAVCYLIKKLSMERLAFLVQ